MSNYICPKCKAWVEVNEDCSSQTEYAPIQVRCIRCNLEMERVDENEDDDETE